MKEGYYITTYHQELSVLCQGTLFLKEQLCSDGVLGYEVISTIVTAKKMELATIGVFPKCCIYLETNNPEHTSVELEELGDSVYVII
jgi:hypothetical protein